MGHAETVVEVMSQTGVSLDPQYCVKAVRGMLSEMKENPHRFAGKRILFLHSGQCYVTTTWNSNDRDSLSTKRK